LPVNFDYIFGFHLFLVKSFVSLIFFYFLLRKITSLICSSEYFIDKKKEIYQFFNFMFLIANFSFFIHLINGELFYSNLIHKKISFTYLHAISFFIIYLYYNVQDVFKLNLNSFKFYISIFFSLSLIISLQYVSSIFFQDFLYYQDSIVKIKFPYPGALVLLIEIFFIFFITSTVYSFYKYKLFDHHYFLTIVFLSPLVIKLTYVFSINFLFIYLLIYLVRYLKVRDLLYFLTVIFIINLFLPLNIFIEFRSLINFQREGISSAIILLSNLSPVEYYLPFSFFKNFFQSLIPFSIFGISIDVLSYSIIICRCLIILICSLLVLQLSNIKYLFLFICIVLSGFLNLFPTDMTAPWTHEYRVLPLYLFIYNFVSLLIYKQKINYFFLGINFAYLLLLDIDLIFSLYILVISFLLFYFLKRDIYKIDIKYSQFFYNSNLIINILILFLINLTFISIVLISKKNDYFLIYSIFISISLFLIFLFINKKNNKYVNFAIGLLSILILNFYSKYSLGYYEGNLESNLNNLNLLFGAYDEIGRSYKESSSYLYDYFVTGFFSNELLEILKNMQSKLVFYDKSNLINFNVKNFIFFYSHILFAILISFYSYCYLFTKNFIILNSYHKVIVIIIYTTFVFYVCTSIKFYLLPDQQRFYFFIRFYHLSLFFGLILLLKYYFFSNNLKKYIYIAALFFTIFPNIIFFKNDAFYSSNHLNHTKNFTYNSSSLSEISNQFKTLYISDSDFYIKRGLEPFVNILEISLGSDVYEHMKIEYDIMKDYNFIPKNFNETPYKFFEYN